jgi:hypothetical protein
MRIARLGLAALLVPGLAAAGSIFLTGHDPDFHFVANEPGENPAGAEKLIQVAIGFAMDQAANPLVQRGARKFVFVSSKMTPPSGHMDTLGAIVNAGYVAGTDFDEHDATTLGSALDALGTTYGGIVVASDFGGILTQAELDVLNARSADIVTFLNEGGGLVAFAESDGGAQLTPSGGQFGFLPFVVTSTAFNQSESGNTLTPFGASLGLAPSDVNGNFSHNVFVSDFGMEVVDMDPSGDILTLAARGTIGAGGVTTTLPTTTTTPTTSTTTTTLTGSCTPPAPTFSSLDCRLAALIARIQADTSLGKSGAQLVKPLSRAKKRKEQAEQACATSDAKHGRSRLKQTIRGLIQYGQRLRSLTGHRRIPDPLRTELKDEGDALKKDAQTLRGALSCPADAAS